MKSPVAVVGERHASTPVTGPSPEVLIAVAEVGRELAAAGALEARLGGALRVLERRLGAGRSVVYSSDTAARSLTVAASHGLDPDAFRPRYSSGAGAGGYSTVSPSAQRLRHDLAKALFEIADLSRHGQAGWNLVAVLVTARGRCVGAHLRSAPTSTTGSGICRAYWRAGRRSRSDRKGTARGRERPGSDPALISRPPVSTGGTQN